VTSLRASAVVFTCEEVSCVVHYLLQRRYIGYIIAHHGGIRFHHHLDIQDPIWICQHNFVKFRECFTRLGLRLDNLIEVKFHSIFYCYDAIHNPRRIDIERFKSITSKVGV
jgi:hypothetical protein